MGPPRAQGLRIRVRGLVQGVGYRPFVWRLASAAGIRGQVRNDGGGVLIDAFGTTAELDGFVAGLSADKPALAQVDKVDAEALEGPAPLGFSIVESAGGAVSTGIVPDAATCPECLAEVQDPQDRRHRYPFTNCTHCGPRLSIVRAVPYDRAATSMRRFAMCPACRAEYEDPADRRFHAQPNACPLCGPQIWLEDDRGPVEAADVIDAAAAALLAGRIVALRGLGGFHLACDATDPSAVARLRARKHRDAKPLAVMVCDLAMARSYAEVSDEEAALLGTTAAPIVVLARGGRALAEGIAPGHDRIGLMLPYTPLHHLLLQSAGRPLVMTSGNLSSEPQVTANAEARERLGGIADLFLLHDRDIVNRLDDSVVRADSHGISFLRRARGYAPAPLPLPDGLAGAPPVLAVGGDLKSAFCLLSHGQAVLSQHMGDLEEARTHADFRRNLDLYRALFDFAPLTIAADLHEGYFSTALARRMAGQVRLVSVQHHHAHLAACMADNGMTRDSGDVIGLTLDGTGLGADGTIWGGEILVGGYESFRRAGHLLPVPLPGGNQAAREPWRNAVAQLLTAFGDEWRDRARAAGLAALADSKDSAVIETMIASGLNAPLCSSAGRLFDAVAALLGVGGKRLSYEGQAGMELEALARPFVASEAGYESGLAAEATVVLSWAELWDALLRDLAGKVERGRIAARFHLGLADALLTATRLVAERTGLDRVVLSGGVMQNGIMLECLLHGLSAAGLRPYAHKRVPANDGGLALGQAAIAACHTEDG